MLAIGIALASPAACLAGSPSELTAAGNAHFAAGRYAEALEVYERIDERGDPDALPELLHNRAAAMFKLGRLEDARDLWVRAASLKDAAFEAKARYNIGNCHYAAALRALGIANQNRDASDPSPDPSEPSRDRQGAGSPSDPSRDHKGAVAPGASSGQVEPAADASAALKLLDQAIEQYRDAVNLDRAFDSARANLELAAKLKRQIEEQSNAQPSSQPNSQPQQDQNQQPSSQPSQDGMDQQKQDEQNQDQQNRSDQPQSHPDQDRNKHGPPSSQPSQDEQNQDDRNRQDRSDPPQSQPQPQPEPQPQSQPSPDAGHPPPEAGDPNSGAPREMPELHLTPEQAERLLQMVRDAERARREALRARMRGPRPVDKDW